MEINNFFISFVFQQKMDYIILNFFNDRVLSLRSFISFCNENFPADSQISYIFTIIKKTN